MPEFESTPATAAGRTMRYLIVQRGAARLDVVRLNPDRRNTVGRASSNRIIIPDAKCSRQHCEIFWRDARWLLRDLDSRNGVTVDGLQVEQEWVLELGQTIGIGACTLVYTDSEPAETTALPPPAGITPYAVVERKAGTRYDPPAGVAGRILAGRHGIPELFQLARAMNAATHTQELAETVLEGLLHGTPAEIGALLLLMHEREHPAAADLQPIAVHSPPGRPLRQFSDYLSQLVLTDCEAILAHDISQHAQLAVRDSLSEMSAESAICAPIRHGGRVLGVIHLYSMQATHPLNADHLEFALAVADQMAGNLHSLQDREQLAAGLFRVESHVAELRQQLAVETELVGRGPCLERLRRAVGRVAPTDATVLIRGESGVGKELVARAVHFNSDRKNGPFVCVNCAALTESLLESELFGHEKGAFTGAAGQKAGKFEQAHGGALFLDEIGEMSPEVQARFLRVLEGQAFERVGGGKPISVDVRVVTATNRDLESAVREGKFRGDLYFRLQVFEIIVPPLREHPEDIPEIAQHFLERFRGKSRTRVQGFNREALTLLCRHPWPGNVRELRNVVERAVILCDHEVLTTADISLSRLGTADVTQRDPEDELDLDSPTDRGRQREVLNTAMDPGIDVLDRFIQREVSLDELDRLYIVAVLEELDWNKSQAARLLGIERTTLDRRLKRYGLNRPGDE